MTCPRTLLIDGRKWHAIEADVGPGGEPIHVTLASHDEMDEWWPYLTHPTLRYAAPVERLGDWLPFVLTYKDGSTLSWMGNVYVLTLDFLPSGARRWLLSVAMREEADQ